MLSQRALEAFQAVVTSGSVSAAAAMLGVSQPAVSRLLRDLEHATGLVLFARTGNRIIPTEAARALVVEVERSFIGLSAIETLAHQIARGMHGTMNIASMPALSSTVLPDVVAELCRQDLDMGIELQSARTLTVISAVARRQAQIGFVAPLHDSPEVAILGRHRFQFRCIMTPDHPLAEKSVIGLKDLSNQPFVGFSSSTATGQALERVFSRMAVPPQIKVRAPLSSVISALARRGVGLAIVDPFTADDHEAQGGVSLPIELTERFDVAVIVPRGVQPLPVAERIYAVFKSRVDPASPAQ